MKSILIAAVIGLSVTQIRAAENCHSVLRHSTLAKLMEVAPQYQSYEQILALFPHWIEDTVSTTANHQAKLDQGEYWLKAHLPWTDEEHLLISLHALVASDAHSQTDTNFQKYHTLLVAAVAEANDEAAKQGWHPIHLKDFPVGVLHTASSSIPMLDQADYRWVWLTAPANRQAPEMRVRPTQMKFLEILFRKLKT